MPPPKLGSDVGLKVPPRTSAFIVEGNSGIPAAPMAIQPQSLNLLNTTWNQIIDSSNQKEPIADTNVQPFGQPDGPPSSCLASNTEGGWIGELIGQLIRDD
ncbi:hypothetical protein BT93_E2431 [Corymbia citriodora subsp. variegata]|nr:hypothetical protein BT93_E2431 [Corymbia citriodora subsp. variegata]